MSVNIEATDVRARIRQALPAYVFERTPSQAWLIILFNIVIIACGSLILTQELAWYWMLALSLVLGHHFFALGIISHDIMHGATLRNKRLRILVSYFGFYPFLISPRLWDAWHNKAHHGRTNTARDPDANLTFEETQRNPIARFGLRLMPSSRNRILGIVFYTYWFTLVGQAILWASHRFRDWRLEEYRTDFQKARLETLSYYLFWLLVGGYAGSYKSVFLIAIPMMLGNIIFMSFASSEHVFLPQDEKNDPLDNSASVRMPAWIDFLTLNFSHHVEHHLFPTMSYLHTPLVRKWLRENMIGAYMELSMVDTFRLIFNTPRLYVSREYLGFPGREERDAIDTRLIREKLRRGDAIKGTCFQSEFAVGATKDGGGL
jgi:fatty acid desaturase